MPRRKSRTKTQTAPKPTTWRATFVREEGTTATVAEVDGRQYVKGKPVIVDRATRERLEGLGHLQFEFQEV